MTPDGDPLAPWRGRLLGLAYRMLGSRADAEDVLQDACIRWLRATGVNNGEAYLVTTVTRLCIDRLKSARTRREVYVGPWLPEPVPDGEALSPETSAELADDLSFALMLVLERLSPAERAAFLLHDVFELGFADVAAMLDRSEASCRQLASRARKAVRAGRPHRPPSKDAHARLLAAFGEAVANGDTGRLTALLREDAVLISDGGGRRLAARNPIVGADRIARFLVGVAGKVRPGTPPVRAEVRLLNGSPGVLTFVGEEPQQTLMLETDGNAIAAVYIVRNPEKLGALATSLA